MNNQVFLDTAYAIALSSEKDDYHVQALNLANELQQKNTQLVTTRPILLEIGNALSRQRYRQAAIQLLDSLEFDPMVEIIELSDVLYKQAYQLFRDRRDKEWGLIDCISFVVMEERSISEALATDEHFQQAGFHVMLREVIT